MAIPKITSNKDLLTGMQRDYSYDYLRAFAAIMIVFCHMCYGLWGVSGIGNYLGGTYVDVFLLLSAYLLGISSRNMIIQDPWNFIKKRAGRLIPTYYTFLTITFLIIIAFIGYDALSSKQIISHYLFLNYFWPSSRVVESPLPQIGHLWFMSCIMFGYLSVLGWSQVIKLIPTLNTNKSWMIYLVVWSVISTFITMKVRFAVYPCTVMLGFVILFFKGPEIINKVHSINSSILILLLILGNWGGVIHFISGGYFRPTISFWINLINALLWIACAPIIFNRTKISRSVLFISTISFEIYLIHHPFCLGAYSLGRYMPTWLASICVLAIAIIGGWILSKFTSFLFEVKNRYSK